MIDDEVIALAQQRIDAVNRRGRDARRRRIREMAKLGKHPNQQNDIFFALEWIALTQKVSAARAAEMFVEKVGEGAIEVTGIRLSTGEREVIPPSLFRGRRQ